MGDWRDSIKVSDENVDKDKLSEATLFEKQKLKELKGLKEYYGQNRIFGKDGPILRDDIEYSDPSGLYRSSQISTYIEIAEKFNEVGACGRAAEYLAKAEKMADKDDFYTRFKLARAYADVASKNAVYKPKAEELYKEVYNVDELIEHANKTKENSRVFNILRLCIDAGELGAAHGLMGRFVEADIVLGGMDDVRELIKLAVDLCEDQGCCQVFCGAVFSNYLDEGEKYQGSEKEKNVNKFIDESYKEKQQLAVENQTVVRN